MTLKTQSQAILEYMKAHGGITQLEATKFLGITRLSARVFDMKAEGVNIQTRWEQGKNRYGITRYKVYYLKENDNATVK